MIKNELLLEVYREIERKNGNVTPKEVVNYAQPKTSSIHTAFEWNDKRAGNGYRLWQARQLIVRAKVIINKKPVQAYYSIRASVENPAYYSIEKIRTDKTLTSEVVAFALSEIEYWLEKYKIIKELVGVVNKQEFERLKKKFEIKEK